MIPHRYKQRFWCRCKAACEKKRFPLEWRSARVRQEENGIYQFGPRFPRGFHSPRHSIRGKTGERSVAKMMLSQMFERIVDGAKGKGEAPLKSTFHIAFVLRVQEHSQTRTTE